MGETPGLSLPEVEREGVVIGVGIGIPLYPLGAGLRSGLAPNHVNRAIAGRVGGVVLVIQVILDRGEFVPKLVSLALIRH
jgi:hypothetical protein